MLQRRLGMSQRRACRVVGQHRSTQRYQPDPVDADADLRAWLRAFSGERPRWGYRQAHGQLALAGQHHNVKKIERLWREEGLQVPIKRRKRRRVGTSTVPSERLVATHKDHVWAGDFQFDVTADGRTIKILNIVDEHTREALCSMAARSIDADATVAALEAIAVRRGTTPEFVRFDNGPELTANAVAVWAGTTVGCSYIDPGSPWQNAYVESFNSRMRDELLAIEQFDTLLEAQVLIADWVEDYNHQRCHSALGMMPPAVYAAGLTTTTGLP